MGASANEIDRQIKETRDRMDENLGVLEERASSNAMRYGKVAAVVLGVIAAGGAAIVLYRRHRRPSMKNRLRAMSVESLRDLADEMATRLKRPLPSVRLTVNDQSAEEPGMFESIVRKVAPAIVGTASTAVMEKVMDEAARAPRGSAPAFD
jgi:cobalamin biosynthesis protein CobT